MRILLTGGEGQLGTELIAQAPKFGIRLLAPTLAQMDLTHPVEVDAAWDGFAPEAVINAAAYTAVDRAESEIDLAFEINAAAPARIAAKMTSSSSNMVSITIRGR